MGIFYTSLLDRMSEKVICDNNYVQVDINRVLVDELSSMSNPKVLDFGGADYTVGVNLIEKMGGIPYCLELLSCEKVKKRKFHRSTLCLYDGRSVPFKSGSFDLIYSSQVFEHVEFLEDVFNELCRILKPGGKIVGSLSQLEPEHESYFNITPLGLESLLGRSGFILEKIGAEMDCFALTALILSTWFIPSRFARKLEKIFLKGSPLNRIIALYGKLKRLDKKKIECIKLLFSGHYVFIAIKV